MKKYFLLIVPVAVSIFLIGCNGESEDPDHDQPETNNNVIPAQFSAPFNETQYTNGEAMEVKIQINRADAVSNLQLFVYDTLYADNLNVENQTISIPTNDAKVGWTELRLSYTDSEGKQRNDTRKVVLFSDVIPAQKTVKIVNTYPHIKESYTQGLEFYQGKFYEGTGRYGQSVLSEIDLNTGDRIRELPLDGSIFGEGITIMNDTIYQITYKAGECYMYDMNFNLLGTHTYAGDGWGLCNDGKYLIMSNGSDELVWRDPKTFEIVKSIFVFDNSSNVGQLNELELMNGNLFMNLYQDNRIIEVDTATGKVLTYIDCRELALDAKDLGNDVLNGIAQNQENGKIYMTGKWWSKLYEVTFE